LVGRSWIRTCLPSIARIRTLRIWSKSKKEWISSRID
jgi:hypothetical protein